MGDNPIYWSGHQRPPWHQQAPTAGPGAPTGVPGGPGQPVVNTMVGHYAGLDPTTAQQLQMQSSIPPAARHPQQQQQQHQQQQQQQQQQQHQNQQTAGLYSNMMTASASAGGAPRGPTNNSQLTSNSHLSAAAAAAVAGLPPHPATIMQPSPHPQSHYPNQYSSLASSYWNPQPQGPPQPQTANSAASQQQPTPATQPDPSASANPYHSAANVSPLSMPNDSRTNLSTNSSLQQQQQQQQQQQNLSAFRGSSMEELQPPSSNPHMMAYDRQRGSALSSAQMAQQQQQQSQHPSAMISQNLPGASTNLGSPNQSQLAMQGRLQSQQSQLDSMRAPSLAQQQPPPPPPSGGSVPSWSSSYYAQPTQSPYSSVMNPYMPYGSPSTVSNHNQSSTIGQMGPTRPQMGGLQKGSTNGGDRARAAAAAAAAVAYPPHASSIYGQPPPSSAGPNASYYGYDSYYNQVANQASSDPYLTHSSSAASAAAAAAAAASQHWPPPSASSSQVIGNTSAAPIPLQPSLRPQTGPTGTSLHPQSPSASSTLPSLSNRPPPPSQTPDRSPAPQLSTSSYPSPNQQGTASKSTSSSLAQLEQMVMPGSNQNTTQPMKSPTQRSSTNSPSTSIASNTQQQQLQYSYNSSGQGSYFSSTSGATNQAANYYSSYDSPSLKMQKSPWTEPNVAPMVNSMVPHGSAPPMMDGSQSTYGQQPPYDSSGGYAEYTPLTGPDNSCNPTSRFPTAGDESLAIDKSDPYAIDSQTFDDFDDQTSSKSKKSRAKKGEDKVKKERKPRAPKTPKAGTTVPQPASPAPTLQQTPSKQSPSLSQTPDMSPIPPNNQQMTPMVEPYLSPTHQQQMTSIKAPAQPALLHTSEQSPSLTRTPDSPSQIAQQVSYGQPQISSDLNPNDKSSTLPTATSKDSSVQGPRSSTNSPSTSIPPNNQQQQLQYSYNSGGPPGYISSTSTTTNQAPGYYSPYESTSHKMQKPWTEPSAAPMVNSMVPHGSAPPMMDGSQSTYGQQPPYDSSGGYAEYTPLTGPDNSCNASGRFSAAPDESMTSEKNDPYEGVSQTPEDLDDQSSSKSKKSRAKKGEDKVKKERKPRAPKTPKAGTTVPQPTSPAPTLQQTPSKQSPSLSQTPDMSPIPPNNQQMTPMVEPYLSPTHQQQVTSIKAAQPALLHTSEQSPSLTRTPDSPSQIAQQVSYGQQQIPSELDTNDNSSTLPTTAFKDGVIQGTSSDQTNEVMTMDYNSTSQLPQGGDVSMTLQPDDQTVEEGQTQPTKAKKSRTRKSDGKPKKERKSRAKVVAPPPAPVETPEVVAETAPQQNEDSISIPADEQSNLESPAKPKPKRIRIRDPSSKGKKKLPKFALKFAKTKKRKRLGSSDNDQSDLDKTPPPSPNEVESGVQKRRSARNTKKLKYNDDIALGFSESDDDSQVLPKPKKTSAGGSAVDGDNSTVDDSVIADEPTVFAAPVEDTMVVEKIMSSRTGKRELEPEPGEVLPPDGTFIDVEEFYVKYKNLSYLHCDWRTLEELERGDRRVAQKVKRYKQKKDSSNLFSFMDEDLFDPQYCEVDRILAVNEVEELVADSDDEESQSKTESQQDSTNQVKPVEPINNDQVSETEKDAPKSEIDTNHQDASEVNKNNDATKVEPESVNSSDATPQVESENMNSTVVDGEKPESTNDDYKKDPKTEQPEKVEKMKKKISRHYLVKWRGLSYEESTWELEDDLDPEKIKQFERFKDLPPKSKWKQVKRPKPEDWVRKEVSPVYKNNNTLREYQLEGINWLSFCWHQGRNCILADEMGLGKTIQSIAFVNEIYQHGFNGPFLIIVPLSTVGNWAREFETWTDLNTITYHGSSTSREMLKEYEMFYRNEQGNRVTSYYKFQVMITTFEIILSDCLDLREIPWRCCIIDEAHRLKNRNCKLLEGLRLLNMEHRVLLTGTPLQNNVEELFSLLNFLEPTQFSSTEQFLQEFGDLKTEAQVDKLKVILKPMMLRRLKEDVEKTLAPKEETIVEVELTNIQKKYYRAILEKNFSFLTKGGTNNNMPNLMNTMMELRKCCIHPYLINGAEEQILYEAKQARMSGGEPMNSFQALVNSSGKLVLIDKLLPRLRADGHRVLIFSQMVRCLDILEDYVTHKHYPFERIDGRVRGSDRQQAIDRFSKPGSDRFVFLLCTRAGGLGINLTAADTVIIFDSDWNPQNDLQAQARCHRIGQSKAVKIYRLICRNTYEREMFDKASLKLGLDKAVLQSINAQRTGSGGLDGQLTKKEIEELLRKGAYGALMDDDNAGDKFCEEDIDQILQRRTQVITIDNSEAKGSTFSKATFSSSNNREDIELDDPNFWEKWAKKANIDSDDTRNKDELIQLAPRRRTQTKRYGADGNLLEMSDLESSEEDEETISMRTRGQRGGRQQKFTPTSGTKRSKRNKPFEFDDEEYLSGMEGGYWSKGDCLKVEKGLLTYGWGRWNEIISSSQFRKELTVEECESISRVILLYCLHSYKGDEKIKSFAWELIKPNDDETKSQSDVDSSSSGRARSSKPAPPPVLMKRTVAEEIAEADWPKEAKHDPLISLPDDQYRRHLQRNCNRLLIRVKFLHYLKNDILKAYLDRIHSDCNISEIDLPSVPVDGDLPATWWDDEADKSLLVGIYKHGHDRFSSMRQDPCLCFLSRCGPPNKKELLAEINSAERNDDIEEENRDSLIVASKESTKTNNQEKTESDSDTGKLIENLLDNVMKEISNDGAGEKSGQILDENKNNILKDPSSQNSLEDSCDNGVEESIQTTKMDVTTDDESMTNEVPMDTSDLPNAEMNENRVSSVFPSASDLNQRFRRLITAYQRNFKKLEIKLAQKARDELKKERTSKFEAAKNEREERKRFLAQKWSRREEADFFRAISSFGVEYDPIQKKHDWNKFRSIGKLDKKLDETLDEYYKAFIVMCKRVLSKPLDNDEEKCPINVDTITEERASRCLSRIEFLNKIREQIITHPELDARLMLCHPQAELPDWWENGKHDKDLLLAAAKHGLTRLDYNLAFDPSLSFDSVIKQKCTAFLTQPPNPILIPIEQLQDLLEKNGVDYTKDLSLDKQEDCIYATINSIIDSIENEVNDEGSIKDFEEPIDGSLLGSNRIPSKSTRSSSSRMASSIIPGQTANTLAKSGDSSNSVRLISIQNGIKSIESRIVEITPILPDNLPEDVSKTFEAGEVSITVISKSALLKLEDREPIVLLAAANPITIKIRWPKDKAIQTRLENLVHLVENNEWPSSSRATVPTITLPNHLSTSMNNSLNVTTSPSKNDKLEMSLGSPKSDISNISSKTSKQDSRERSNDLGSKNRRGRGRRPRQSENEQLPQDMDSFKEDRQATAKLRNLLSQGPSSARSGGGSSSRMDSKFGNNKQDTGFSSLLASFKQGRQDGGSSRRDDKNMLDLNAAGSNLLPQILANMKPEFRDLLANQDAATILLNSLSGMPGNLATSLRSLSGSQLSLDNLLNPPPRTSSKSGPPPAHQRDSQPSGSDREMRRSSHTTRENSPPSFNLRSTRGKGCINLDALNNSKSSDFSSGKLSSSRKKAKTSLDTLESSQGPTGADVLDLSSLPGASKVPTSRLESRSRRHRDVNDELAATSSPRSGTHSGGKSAHKSSSKPSPDEEAQGEGVRTTRASKRIGSRIDALALNLQAKKLNRGDSPTSDLSPSLPKDNPAMAHGSSKSSSDSKSHSSKGPPAAHSSSQKHSSNSSIEQSREKSNPTLPTSLNSQTSSSSAMPIDPFAQLMANSSSLLPGLNPVSLGGGTNDIMNQLLRKAGSNDLVKNLLNDLLKNPLDPNILASLTTLGSQGIPGFNLMSTAPTTLPTTSQNKTTSSSLLNDFKFPANNSLMKRSRQDSSGNLGRHSGSSASGTGLPSEGRRSSTSTPDKHERRSSSSADRRSHSDKSDKQQSSSSSSSKHDKRLSGLTQDTSAESSSARRSSSSLLAQQMPSLQQTSQAQTAPSLNLPLPTSLPSASTLNLANQFGGLNSLGGLLNFPGMNELMKQMTNFPGLAANLPRVSGAPLIPNTTTNATIPNNSSEKSNRRSRQSGGTSSTPMAPSSVASQQQATNAALASSLMNLASQPTPTSNPYSNYTSPLTNPFLPFGLAGLGMNNPLGMSLFPNLYGMPSGFPNADQQQPQQSNQTNGPSEDGSKDKKMRYPRK